MLGVPLALQGCARRWLAVGAASRAPPSSNEASSPPGSCRRQGRRAPDDAETTPVPRHRHVPSGTSRRSPLISWDNSDRPPRACSWCTADSPKSPFLCRSDELCGSLSSAASQRTRSHQALDRAQDVRQTLRLRDDAGEPSESKVSQERGVLDREGRLSQVDRPAEPAGRYGDAGVVGYSPAGVWSRKSRGSMRKPMNS